MEFFSNGSSTLLAAPCSSTDTTITVQDASAFPSSGNFRILLGTPGIDAEICTVTAVAGTTWTVTRASEPYAGSSTPNGHGTGTPLNAVLTAGSVILAGGSGGTVTSVATGVGLTGGPITTTGTLALADTAVTPGSYGDASNVGQFTVDQQGRITSAANVGISGGGGTPGGLDKDVQYNAAGSFGGSPNLQYDYAASGTLNVITSGTNPCVYANNSTYVAKLADNARAVTASDGANSVYLADGTYGVNDARGIWLLNSVLINWPNAQGAAGTVLSNSGAGVLSWVAPTASVAIGSTVSSGRVNDILFVDISGNLANSDNFQWINATNQFQVIGQAGAIAPVVVYSDPGFNFVFFGARYLVSGKSWGAFGGVPLLYGALGYQNTGNPMCGVYAEDGTIQVNIADQSGGLFTCSGVTDGAAGNVGTLNNAPAAGDPAGWLKITVSGTVRYIPYW